jgi:ribokinase
MNLLKKEGINIDYIYMDDANPTGMAFINVDDNGENSIVVVPGANMNINIDEIRNAENVIKNSKVVISQFETTIESTIEAFKIAKQNNISTILNPAPVREIPEDLLTYTDIIIPNETEASKFTGIEIKDIESLKKSCEIILNKGVKFVIITLGDKGAAIASKEKFEIIPAYKVKAVDTTAAGDGFIGALASNLAEENINFENIKKAVQFANKVSSIIVQREGAQPSLPYLNEVMESFEGEKND